MTSVYVVFMWTDHRKENEAKILGIYRKRETAVAALRKFAKDHIGDDEDCCNIGEWEDCFNIISGDNCNVFEMKLMPLIDD